MALSDRTSIRRLGLTAIAAGDCTALAVANSGSAWGQDAGDQAGAPAAPEAEMMAPGGMQMMMGAPSDGGDTAPLTGHGFLLDKGVFTTIDHPDAVAETATTGINNRGQILGQYIDADGTEHGFLLDDGVFTTIDHPDAASGPLTGTAAVGLNDRGQIVGFYGEADGPNHGFLLDQGRGFRREGVFTAIDHPDAGTAPGTGTAAVGINNRGRIVGFYLDAGGMGHGFLRDKGVFTPIDHPDAGSGPGTGTLALGLNDRGQIVGAYVDAEGTSHGFLLDEGDFTTIDHPDAASGPGIGTVLFGVNNRGQIVGQYIDTDLRCHGLLRSRSTFTTIDDPGAMSYTGAVDINDRGQIVGFSDARIGFVACFPEASASARDQCADAGSCIHPPLPVVTDEGAESASSDPRADQHGFGRGTNVRGGGRLGVFGALVAAMLMAPVAGATAAGSSPSSEIPVFALERGRFTAFDTPGEGAQDFVGINNRGEIVGGYKEEFRLGEAACGQRGFLRNKRGRFIRIDVPGAGLTAPIDINKRGYQTSR